MVTRALRQWLALCVALAFAGAVPAAVEIDDYASAAAAYQHGDYAEAWRIWLPLAREGDVDAQFSLGMLCDREPPIADCDSTSAIVWYESAAKGGHRLAQFSLGSAYRDGRGVARDDTKARYWLGKAAAQGLPAARDALQSPDTEELGLARGRVDTGDDDDLHVAAAPSAVALPAVPPAAPDAVASPAGAVVVQPDTETQWLSAQDPAHYTAQLATSPDAQGLRAVADRHTLGEAAHVLCARGTCYLVFGVFATREQAWSAISGLPEPARANKPWPRPLSYYRSVDTGAASGAPATN